jgi:hypothetical protein
MTGKTMAERQAEVDALIARALDPADPYDGHHGRDRSEEALAASAERDPEAYARTLEKIAAEEASA